MRTRVYPLILVHKRMTNHIFPALMGEDRDADYH